MSIALVLAETDACAAGAPLLGDVAAFCGRYVAYPSDHAQIAHTLWIAHTHLMDAWDTTPRLTVIPVSKTSTTTATSVLAVALVLLSAATGDRRRWLS